MGLLKLVFCCLGKQFAACRTPHVEHSTAFKRESVPGLVESKNALPNSHPPELLIDTIDSRLKVVNGTGVLSPGTNGLAQRAEFSHSCNLQRIRFAGAEPKPKPAVCCDHRRSNRRSVPVLRIRL